MNFDSKVILQNCEIQVRKTLINQYDNVCIKKIIIFRNNVDKSIFLSVEKKWFKITPFSSWYEQNLVLKAITDASTLTIVFIQEYDLVKRLLCILFVFVHLGVYS